MSFTESFDIIKSEYPNKTDTVRFEQRVTSVCKYKEDRAFTVDYGYGNEDAPNNKESWFEMIVPDGRELIFSAYQDTEHNVLWVFTKNFDLYSYRQYGTGISYGGTDDGVNWDYGRGVGLSAYMNYTWGMYYDVYRTGITYYLTGNRSEFSINIPIYNNEADAISHAKGEETQTEPINMYTPPVDTGKQYYINNKTFNQVGSNPKTLESEFHNQFYVLGSNSLALVRGDYGTGNLFLRYTGSRIDRLDVLTGTWYRGTDSLGQYEYWDAGTYEIDDGLLISSFSTNIPIFSSNDDYLDYLSDGDISRAENAEDVINNITGEDLTSTEIANTSCGNSFATIYILDREEVANIRRWLFRTDTRALFEACLWGDKPIEMVVDFNWVPLTMGQFGLLTSQRPISFGDVTAKIEPAYTEDIIATGTNYAYGSNVTLCNTTVFGTFGDWRDYECAYKLALPYYGIIDLDPKVLIGNDLKVECNYFLTSKILKHYVFINNVLYGEYEASLGCSMSLTSVDQASKARENFSALSNIVGGTLSYGTGMEYGMPANMIGGVNAIAEGVMSAYRGVSHDMWGNNSASAAVNDVPYCYLIIEAPVYVVPEQLHSLYNYATYYMGKIGTSKGYTEVSDVRLTGMGGYSDQEKEQLKAILKGGVIL